MLLKCPKSETLLEFVSIPEELPRRHRTLLQVHAWRCSDCRDRIDNIRERWLGLFQPEPDITSSLMKVYSRLQSDQTLVLKGWKLEPTRPVARPRNNVVVPWPVAAGIAAFVVVTGFSVVRSGVWPGGASKEVAVTFSEEQPDYPMAQMRVEDKNSVKVQYVRPQLLQTIEFETDPHHR